MKSYNLLLPFLILLLIGCAQGNPTVVVQLTATPIVISATADISTALPVATPTPADTVVLVSTPTTLPSLSVITPTLSSLQIALSPTTPPAGPALATFCHIPSITPTPQPATSLYFRVERQGWYRTDDNFATNTLVAPYGVLSRDLKYLVTFDCQGMGTVCVASPPTASPTVLPTHYAPGGGIVPSATWMADGRRLIFQSSVLLSRSSTDTRLYLLDLNTTQLVELASKMEYDFDVSPVGDCVAYRSFEKDVDDIQLHIATLEGDRVREVWRAPAEGDLRFRWPNYGDSLFWSRDGNRLGFTTTGGLVVRIWDLTTGLQEVYDLCAQQGRGNCGASTMRWSPDEKHIYFTWASHWFLDLTTGKIRKLFDTNSVGRYFHYQWFPDSKSLIVPGLLGKDYRLWVDGHIEGPLSHPGEEDAKLIDGLFW